MPEQRLTLSGLRDGGLEERFQAELARVMENIADPNTPQKSVRRIEIKVALLPSEDRAFAAVTCDVSVKLANRRPVTTFTLFDVEDGVRVAIEKTPRRGNDPRQNDLGSVTPIGGKRKS